ncbi:MAG: hypothetical protein MUO84_03905 [Thermoplasmata archaeon]|nr:hypothetical protein [Thermoplasmata archaeon]
MVEEIVRAFESDIESIPLSTIMGETYNERIMKLCVHIMLGLWTRIALETGQKLTMTPYQYSLGIYHGQMNWVLNEALNYKDLPQVELSGTYGKRHALVAESYNKKGEEWMRLVFALDEEDVKGKPLPMNYLLYDVPLTEFAIGPVLDAIKTALPKWVETIRDRSEEPLSTYCKESLEFVDP